MTRHAARWILVAAGVMYAASMVLPVRSLDTDRYVAGFSLAYLSMVGVVWMIPVCMAGAVGNVGFVVALIVGLVRAGGRTGGPGLGLFIWACFVWLTMLVAWIWTGVVIGWGTSLAERVVTPGGVAWVMSGGLLAWGCWAVRRQRFRAEAMGFEVIPVARRAVTEMNRPPIVP